MAEEKPSFEESLGKLERLVAEMETGNLPIDEMMAKFEEGRRLSAYCTSELASIRERIEKVVSAPSEPVRTAPLDL